MRNDHSTLAARKLRGPSMRVLIEAMEQRVLMSAVAFQLDPMRSIVSLSGNAAGYTFQEQGAGSLTTSYSGTINADVSGGMITLTGGSNIVAANSGVWDPNTAPANYGAMFDAGIIGNGVAAARGLVFDAMSPAAPVAMDGTFDSSNTTFTATAGQVDYDATFFANPYTGTDPATGQAAQNQAQAGMYTVSNGVATLVIPVNITLNFSVVTQDDTQATLTGDLVATANLQSGSANLVSTAFSNGSTNTNQAQRSEVRQITMTFDHAVTLGAGAVSLSLLNTGGSGKNDGSAPTDASAALGTPTSADGGITWVIPVLKSTTFSDATGSLKDGIYTVTVDPTKVTGATLNTSNLSTTFHRRFGDINGDKTVNNADYFKFNKAFNSTSGQPAYNPDFDFNGDGTINNTDYFQFNKNFGKTFTY